MESYSIVFDFMRDLDKSIMVKKKTKTLNKVFFIPKSVVIKQRRYKQKKSLWKDAHYEKERISIQLPSWFVKKELGFYK